MKSITVKNISLQFDTFDDGADVHTIHQMIDEINEELQERFQVTSPQISSGVIEDDDFYIIDTDDI